MKRYFVISDTHFGHAATWEKFKNEKGEPLRPFSSTEEMNETIIENWNKTVTNEDVVYHLGDYIINRKWMHIGGRLNGRKRLVAGNHDIFDVNEYLQHFEDIKGCARPAKYPVFMTHVPIHPSQFSRHWLRGNVHGHLHGHYVKDQFGKPDKRYFCASVENINYTPMDMEEVMAYLPELD